MDISWIFNSTGWIGVALGLIMFALGFFKGIAFAKDRLIDAVIASTIASMIKDGYVRSQKIYNAETGEWEEELLKLDE
jgi:hypothetical protein